MARFDKNFMISMDGLTNMNEPVHEETKDAIPTFNGVPKETIPEFTLAGDNEKNGNEPNTGDPKPKYTSAEQKIVDLYTKKGYIVGKDSTGKLTYKKDPTFKSAAIESRPATTNNQVKVTNKIPLPNYKDPNSRLEYAKEFSNKYGQYVEKRADTPLRFNEKPAWGTDTSINLAKKATSSLGLDPVLFYVSSMEEGQSGLYTNEKGLVKTSGNKEYPVSGLWSFGLDSFPDKYKDLIKKGYLPADFEQKFILGKDAGSSEDEYGALFKNTDAAVQASAAMLKTHYDDVDNYVTKNKIKLSPKARDFFALASFNGGEGVGRQMILDYYTNGLLKDDSFLKKRPTSGKGLKETSYKQVYDNVIRRIIMADALKSEGYIDDQDASTNQVAKK